jgi:hypothetical protein
MEEGWSRGRRRRLGDGGGTDVAIWEGDLRVNTRKGDAVKWKVNGEGRLRGQNPFSPLFFSTQNFSLSLFVGGD